MEGTPLFTFLYHYGLGSVLFVLGMYGAWRAGALDLSVRRHRAWAVILILGLLGYMVGHAVLQFLT